MKQQNIQRRETREEETIQYEKTEQGITQYEKIGILGGTFNPVHKGHLQMAKESQRLLSLDRVIFIPAAIPPLKFGEITPYSLRRHWLEQAIQGEETWEISDIEQQRQGVSYTYDTLLTLQHTYPQGELYFLTGADSLTTLTNWYHWQEILDLCYFVVTTRPGYTMQIPEEIAVVNQQAQKGIRLLTIDALPISSTEVRTGLQSGRKQAECEPVGQEIDRFIPREIIDEVKQAWHKM